MLLKNFVALRRSLIKVLLLLLLLLLLFAIIITDLPAFEDKDMIHSFPLLCLLPVGFSFFLSLRIMSKCKSNS